MPKNTKLIYVTAPGEDEAASIARALVDERLVACVNIIPAVRSIYRWQGTVEDEKETVLIMKTVDAKVSAVTQKIKSLHSYDCPCVVALDIDGGNDDFLEWIAGETA